jgi:hypothetical protein
VSPRTGGERLAGWDTRMYIRMMLSWPIRYDVDTWLCMRNDPVLPKAIIKRIWVTDKQSGQRLMKFRAVTWDLDPTKRTLIGYYNDVGEANEAVTIETPDVTATCAGCDEPMAGRADRRYCSSACRQRAYRNSQRENKVRNVEVEAANGMYEQCRTLTEPWLMDQLSPGVKRYLVKTLREAADVLEAEA